MLLDEGKAVARRTMRQGVSVVWEEWEAMPHCFAQVLQHLPVAQICNTHWAGFCEQVVVKGANSGIDPARVQTKGTWYAAKTGKEETLDVRNLGDLSDDEIMQRMKAARAEKSVELNTPAKTGILPKL